ncbi:hypothetical protein [Inhella crocodyli]|nr:hypothetical protein [Inhella crocodyli]
MKKSQSLLKPFALGIATSLVVLVASLFGSTEGVRVNTAALPPAVQSIMDELPGEPLSSEQLNRIKGALDDDAGQTTPSHMAAAELRKAWPLAVLVGLFACVLAWMLWRPITLGAGTLVLGPTALLVLGAFAHTHPYLL